MNTVKAIYPGTFDPPTNGHLDLVARGSKMFDHLVVAILKNTEKSPPLFSVSERKEMLAEAVHPFGNVSVATFNGLLVDFVTEQNAQVIIRGVRAISDYEYELQMALMNRKLQPGLETVFMMPAARYSYLSSRLVREVAQLGGPVDCLVPDLVAQKLREKMEVANKFSGANRSASENSTFAAAPFASLTRSLDGLMDREGSGRL